MSRSTISFETEGYLDQKKRWPKTGRHILASYDDSSIVVYQAFNPEIAEIATKNGRFGGPKYNLTRMTWVKTNFLWMMYRCGWATKDSNQHNVLAIRITHEGFQEILREAKEGKGVKGSRTGSSNTDDVRLQWDPDHSPCGGSVDRRAVQLGLRGDILKRFHADWIISIEDITDFVKEQHVHVKNGKLAELVIPRERVYIPDDVEICRHIRLDGFEVTEVPIAGAGDQEDPDVGGACCSDLLDGDSKRLAGSTNREATTTTDIVICLGGAFNPVHTRHVEAMIEVKNWLEKNTCYRVVAGRLAVAPDGYVRAKCAKTKQKCMKSQHRIKLCEIACEEYDWLKPYPKAVGSAGECGIKMEREMHAGVRSGIIVGADRAMSKAGVGKWHKENGPITICIGREGETDAVKDVYERDRKARCVENKTFYIVPRELDNVSSTKVRDKLSNHDATNDEASAKIIDELVELGWISRNEGTYIVQNVSEMYFED